VKQCAVLLVNSSGRETSHHQALERLGFQVTATTDWPADTLIRSFEVVIVILRHMGNASMLAARLRAKPHFGQRVLIAVVPATAPSEERRDAIGSGFDDVASDSDDSRALIARVLRSLRRRPEFRCFLPDRKRRAA
jgi:DNA-binding response OmpR family regulator